MRISDWSSDVCSSDLLDLARLKNGQVIRSWASRAATSPGTDRNRSSWVRSAKREDARRVTEFSLRPDGAWLGKRCRYRDRRSTGGCRAWPRHRDRRSHKRHGRRTGAQNGKEAREGKRG